MTKYSQKFKKKLVGGGMTKGGHDYMLYGNLFFYNEIYYI